MPKNRRRPSAQSATNNTTSHSPSSHSNTNTKATGQATDIPSSTPAQSPTPSSSNPISSPTASGSHPITIPKGSNTTILGLSLSPPVNQSPEGGFARDVFVSRRGQKLRMSPIEDLSNVEAQAKTMKGLTEMKGTRKVARSFEKRQVESSGSVSAKKSDRKTAAMIDGDEMSGEEKDKLELEDGMSSGEEVEVGSESDWDVVSSDGEGGSYKLTWRGRDSME